MTLYHATYVGYHDDVGNHTFGFFRKGEYVPQSNLSFEFVAEVVCESNPQSSGFLLSVTREGSDCSRY